MSDRAAEIAQLIRKLANTEAAIGDAHTSALRAGTQENMRRFEDEMNGLIVKATWLEAELTAALKKVSQ